MINNTSPLTYAELIIKPCSLEYGVAPCTASGDVPCYNSPRSCQDHANYTPGDEQILRWCEPTEDLPITIDARPCITSISIRPQKLDPGESMGTRESGTVTMHNFRDNDVEFDKYLSDRDFNPYNQGTYWGKFFSRWGNLQGCEFRVVKGFKGQTLEEMKRRYYVVESHDGPDSQGNVSFTFKDVLKLLDGDKAQAPEPSPGSLAAGIDAVAMSFTLTPAGVGNARYPSSGFASIGDENVTYTRVNDVVTLTARGLRGSKADSHDEGETFQLPLVFDGESPAYIINYLVENHTDTPDEYRDLSVWEDEVNTYIGRLYSADIMRPTPVKTLINELIKEVGLIFYTDLLNKKIALKAMRAFVATISINDDYFIKGTITSKIQSEKRISEVWTYYGKRNPLEKQDEKKNYAAIYASITQNPIVALENSPRSIREIASRWITVFNQPAAVAINQSLLARYEMAPREVAFKIPREVAVVEGQAINISSRIFEDSQGGPEPEFQCQILQVLEDDAVYTVLAEEVRFTQIPVEDDRIINITEDVFNLNLRSVHDSIYVPAEDGDTVKLILAPGVKIGSATNLSIALNIGDWPEGVIIEIHGDSSNRIQGAGGPGGTVFIVANKKGGTALYTRFPISIFGDIELWGGGGGAGGTTVGFSYNSVYYPGGGGAGYVPGGHGATTESGGGGTLYTTKGGDPGEAGTNSTYPGGAAGNAIDGISFVTLIDSPDIKGVQVN